MVLNVIGAPKTIEYAVDSSQGEGLTSIMKLGMLAYHVKIGGLNPFTEKGNSQYWEQLQSIGQKIPWYIADKFLKDAYLKRADQAVMESDALLKVVTNYIENQKVA